jgi:hypothetical protein
MSASATAPEARAAGGADWRAALVQGGLLVFASYHLALAAWMAVSPHSFFTAVGPFGVRNDHYIRDTATFEAALGVGLLIALRRPAWRVPVLGVVALQFALHSLNHLVDIGAARPEWTGYFDFFSLAVSSALLLWLLALARQSPHQGGSQ